MKSKLVIENKLFEKEVPYLTITLDSHEARELYTYLGKVDSTDFTLDAYRQLEEFLREYDSGKYDKYTKVAVESTTNIRK